MDREKYIVVPKNKTAMEHFDHGIENEAELEIVTLSYPEFIHKILQPTVQKETNNE